MLAAGAIEAPHVLRASKQTVVRFEIFKGMRDTSLFEVAGRCAHDAIFVGQFAGHEGRIFQFSNPNGEIKALADDIDEMIGQMHLDFDIGILGQNSRDMGRDMQPAKRGWR